MTDQKHTTHDPKHSHETADSGSQHGSESGKTGQHQQSHSGQGQQGGQHGKPDATKPDQQRHSR